jgi:hypothetical protein
MLLVPSIPGLFKRRQFVESGNPSINPALFEVSYFTNPGGTFEKSGPSPSAIVGWASTASRSFQ